MSAFATTPEEVADLLILGVLEQSKAKVPAIYAHLSRMVPAGGVLIGEDTVRLPSASSRMP